MKELIVTKEMEMYQKIARETLASGIVDLGAVYLGWKIQPGTVLVDENIGLTVTLLSEKQTHLYANHTVCPSKGIDRNMEINIIGIAKMIILKGAKVYYN